MYPNDANTYDNELQFFYGDSILVSPVTGQDQNSVEAYFPDDLFYDWFTGELVHGNEEKVKLENLQTTDIPIHIRGGSVIPLRSKSAMTTTELRGRGFEIVVAPNVNGYARGELYLDDGESLHPEHTSLVQFEYAARKLTIRGEFGYQAGVVIESVTVLGEKSSKRSAKWKRGGDEEHYFNATMSCVTKKVNIELNGPAVVEF